MMSTFSLHTITTKEGMVCKLHTAVQVLENGTLKPMQRKLGEVKINRAQCAALLAEYQVGFKVISIQMAVLINFLSNSQLNDTVKERCFWLCLYSLAEIERCLQRGAVYISSCAVPELHRAVLKLNPLAGRTEMPSDGNLTFSMLSASLLQEFLFHLDLVLVRIEAFSEVSRAFQNWDLNKRCSFPDFKWCAESCRLAIVNKVYQIYRPEHHILLQSSSAVELANMDTKDLLSQLRVAATKTGWFPWTSRMRRHKQGIVSYLMQILEEPTVQPDSLPTKFKIGYQDLKLSLKSFTNLELFRKELLGKGASGLVLRCTWLGEDVVVKIVHGALEGPENKTRFLSEVSILASLQHPNTVRILGFGFKEEKKEGFIVMERMEMDLSSLMDSIEVNGNSDATPFPLDVTIDVLLQISEGMCYLKQRKVMHRDLKPQNILVNRPDSKSEPFERFYHVKLADFGTSKFRLSSRYFTTQVGTRAYMAPEILASTIKSSNLEKSETNEGYTWKADVYSFGIICSVILTGKHPFDEIRTYRELHAAIIRGERPPLPDCTPDPLKRLIVECWDTNPEKRPDIWKIRKRLWECRLFQIRQMDVNTPPTSWQGFCSRVDSLQCRASSQAERYSLLGSSSRKAIYDPVPSESSSTAGAQGIILRCQTFTGGRRSVCSHSTHEVGPRGCAHPPIPSHTGHGILDIGYGIWDIAYVTDNQESTEPTASALIRATVKKRPTVKKRHILKKRRPSMMPYSKKHDALRPKPTE